MASVSLEIFSHGRERVSSVAVWDSMGLRCESASKMKSKKWRDVLKKNIFVPYSLHELYLIHNDEVIGGTLNMEWRQLQRSFQFCLISHLHSKWMIAMNKSGVIFYVVTIIIVLLLLINECFHGTFVTEGATIKEKKYLLLSMTNIEIRIIGKLWSYTILILSMDGHLHLILIKVVFTNLLKWAIQYEKIVIRFL